MSNPQGRINIRLEQPVMEKPRCLMHPDPEDFDGIKRYVYTGLKEAYLNGYPIPWDKAIELCEEIQRHPDLTPAKACEIVGAPPEVAFYAAE